MGTVKKIKKVKQNKSKKLTREEKRFYKKHNRYMTAAEKKQASEQKEAQRKKIGEVAKKTGTVLNVLKIFMNIAASIISLFLLFGLIYAIKAIIEGLKSWGGG